MSRLLLRLLGAVPPGGDAVSDAELLRRYAATRDAAAFELLVRRHADAVWTACVRVLRNEHDADDAFQTTFLVLARKAGSVRGSCAGGWLHRVAVNAALKLKAGRTRSVSDGVNVRTTPSLTLRVRPEPDDLAAVHEELARLPDRYRLPVVLCERRFRHWRSRSRARTAGRLRVRSTTASSSRRAPVCSATPPFASRRLTTCTAGF
jgi:DNA-directed RNA polymerase specialized sigma24 family protein